MFDCIERSEMKITICYFWLQIWNPYFFSFGRLFIIKLRANLFCLIKGFLKQRLSQENFASFCNKFNPFVPNEPFLYPKKTSKNLTVFWCFQGVWKWCKANGLILYHLWLLIPRLQSEVYCLLQMISDKKILIDNRYDEPLPFIQSLLEWPSSELFFFDVTLWNLYKYIAFNIFFLENFNRFV